MASRSTCPLGAEVYKRRVRTAHQQRSLNPPMCGSHVPRVFSGLIFPYKGEMLYWVLLVRDAHPTRQT